MLRTNLNRIRALALALTLALALAATPAAAQRGRKTPSAVTVTSAGTLVLAAASTTVRSVLIVNNGAVTVYMGPATVTTANGIPLAPGQSLSDKDSLDAWYGITASDSAEVRVLETK
jgi:hypothetical protein